MKLLGPLFALLAIGLAGYMLYSARTTYQNTPASQENYPGTLRSAIAQAKAENKNVVAMFTATWCGPCQYMKREVFPSSVVRAQSGRFVWVYLDVDNSANQAAAREFGVRGIPAIHILNGQGRDLDSVVGGRSPEDFAAFLAKY